MLKRLYNEYDLKIEPILIKEYRRLKLTTKELNVLLALITMYKVRRTFSITTISKKIDYSQDEIAPIVESLLDKQFINIKMESKNKRQREVFDFDGTFDKITSLFNEDKVEKTRELQENDVSDIVLRFERNIGRILRNNELEKIRSWFEDDKFSHKSIVKAIDLADNRTSIAYVERILSQEIPAEIKIDKKTEQALEELFKKL